MPIKHVFNRSGEPVSDDGSTILTIQLWAESLSVEDKAVWDSAEAARLAAEQQQVDLGNLTLEEDTGNYIWADGADTESVSVAEWVVFYNRYNAENNVTVTVTIEEV
jgi:hypothetical protein